MTTIEITSLNLSLYGLIIIGSFVLMFWYKQDFNKEGLIDYCIYLVTKILLFGIFFSSLLIFFVLLIDGFSANMTPFVKQLIVIFLNYAFVNYSILYFIKFWKWVIEIKEKNDLYGFELFKKQAGNKK